MQNFEESNGSADERGLSFAGLSMPQYEPDVSGRDRRTQAPHYTYHASHPNLNSNTATLRHARNSKQPRKTLTHKTSKRTSPFSFGSYSDMTPLRGDGATSRRALSPPASPEDVAVTPAIPAALPDSADVDVALSAV